MPACPKCGVAEAGRHTMDCPVTRAAIQDNIDKAAAAMPRCQECGAALGREDARVVGHLIDFDRGSFLITIELVDGNPSDYNLGDKISIAKEAA
jgi:hypothetical protein